MELLGLDSWQYEDFFEAAPPVELHPVIQRVEDYIAQRNLEAHPFFKKAMHSKEALILWVTQELVMTNAFSQIVLNAASYVQNVHVRAVLSEVAFGEHGVVRKGCAKKSHPWLLDQLRRSIGIKSEQVRPAQATREFIQKLASTVPDTICAVAAIGVGNERLIIPEYNAIKKCFANIWPEALHEPFLNANINEDMVHSRLCYEAASTLIAGGADAEKYYSAAVASIENRWDYFSLGGLKHEVQHP